MKLTPLSLRYPSPRRRPWLRLIQSLLLASSVMMAGCVPTTVVKTDFCTGWKPIYVSGKDVLTDGTAKQIQQHDVHGVAIKCWKAPGK